MELKNKYKVVKDNKRIIGGAIGNCVHVGGVFDYLKLSEYSGYEIKFLGASVSVQDFITSIKEFAPSIVCISYRLTASSLESILKEFFFNMENENLLVDKIFYFGGTPECIEVAKKYSYFDYFFQGEEELSVINETLFLNYGINNNDFIVHERILFSEQTKEKSFDEIRDIFKGGNYQPMIRHHFGLPSLKETRDGIKKIAESKLVDIISIATDQNAQEYFFDQENMDPRLDGAGGVPVRSKDDLFQLYDASQCGNYPRLRTYSGTKNLLQWAEISVETLQNAWGTIPLFWYSKLDGRSKRPLVQSIKENMEVIKWYADRDIPVEINDPHHWSLRDGSDVTAVVDAYLIAYNAKKLGVKKYVAQFMFNTPRQTSGTMDLAKMMAKAELISELEDENFIVLKQVRAGLTHFSIDLDVAKGQLAASTILQMALKPQIVHVVSYSEASHAATPENVIESCKIVKGVMKNTLIDFPNLALDPRVIERKEYLKREAKKAFNIISNIYGDEKEDPLSNPKILADIVQKGILDAPHLQGNSEALGKVKTMCINGGFDIIDSDGKQIDYSRYISGLLEYEK